MAITGLSRGERKMKGTRLTSIVHALLPLLLVIGLQATAWSQSTRARHNRVVGVWDVQVAILDCSTGTQLFSFAGLHKYELGGTAQVVPATSPTALSAHMGVWKHVRKNQYQLTFKMFRFDPDGNNIGWSVVKNDVAISEGGTEYAGSGHAEVFDANGNVVGQSCPTFTGTRLQN